MKRTSCLGYLALVVSLSAFAPAPAEAAAGWVSGRLMHYQNQGSYCDLSDPAYDCTGATYLSSEFGQYVPVRNVKVFMRDQSGVLIGAGVTDNSGNFKIFWWRSTMPSAASFYWTAQHAEKPIPGQNQYWRHVGLLDELVRPAERDNIVESAVRPVVLLGKCCQPAHAHERLRRRRKDVA